MTNIEKSKDSIFQKGFGWTYVGAEMAEKHNAENSVFVRKMKRRNECNCPRNKIWYCDQNCTDCMFRYTGVNSQNSEDNYANGCLRNLYSSVSLDADVSNEDGAAITLADQMESTDASPEEVVENMELGSAIAKAISNLKEDEQELIRLAFVERLSDGKIAEKLGINARTTVSSRKMKILKKMGDSLKNFF